MPLSRGAFSPTSPVFVFYCPVTNHHKTKLFKEYVFIISGSVGQESGNDLDRSFAQDLPSLRSLCWWVSLLSEASELSPVGRIHFLVAVGLMVVGFKRKFFLMFIHF